MQTQGSRPLSYFLLFRSAFVHLSQPAPPPLLCDGGMALLNIRAHGLRPCARCCSLQTLGSPLACLHINKRRIRCPSLLPGQGLREGKESICSWARPSFAREVQALGSVSCSYLPWSPPFFGKFIISLTAFSGETQINFPSPLLSQASQSLNARQS